MNRVENNHTLTVELHILPNKIAHVNLQKTMMPSMEVIYRQLDTNA